MPIELGFSGWDIVLIGVVSLMGCAVAYLPHPEHKAFVLILPIPFTLASLSLGQRVDATNVLGLAMLFGFSFGIWALHTKLRLPILPTIVLCAVGYCAAGTGMARLSLTGELVFWISATMVMTLALVLILVLPHRLEPAHRTPLPIAVKLPVIALVVTGLVILKAQLGGFITTFPMVGVLAAYEARKGLWTIVRRIPWVMLLLTPMVALIRLTQDKLGLSGALGLAWPVFLTALWLLRRQLLPLTPSMQPTVTKPMSN